MTTRFHWVRCQLDTISKCTTENAIELALTVLPKDINETYERILLKIIREGEEIANAAEKILMWLVGAMRPLHLLELEEAMMIEPGRKELNMSSRLIDPTDILTICGSLVEDFLDEEGIRIVRLSHYTVQVSRSHPRLRYCNKLLTLAPLRNSFSTGISPRMNQNFPDIIFLWKKFIQSSQYCR